MASWREAKTTHRSSWAGVQPRVRHPRGTGEDARLAFAPYEQPQPGRQQQQRRQVDRRAATGCGARSARSDQYPGTLLELGLEGAMLGEPLEVAPPVTVTVIVAVGPTAEWSACRSEASIVCCPEDRKSTRLNSSHVAISYAVF